MEEVREKVSYRNAPAREKTCLDYATHRGASHVKKKANKRGGHKRENGMRKGGERGALI